MMLIPRFQVSDQVALEIASCIPGSSVAHWSVPRLRPTEVPQYEFVQLEMKKDEDQAVNLLADFQTKPCQLSQVIVGAEQPPPNVP